MDAWYFALHARAGSKPTWLSIRRTKYFPGRTTSHKCNSRQIRERNSSSDATTRSGDHSCSLSRSRSSFSRGTEMVITTVSMSYPSNHNGVSHSERSYVEPTEWDPVRILPQRADNGPTRKTRMRVDSAGYPATIVPPPISRRLRSKVRKRWTSFPPPDRGGPDSQVAMKPANRLLLVG